MSPVRKVIAVHVGAEDGAPEGHTEELCPTLQLAEGLTSASGFPLFTNFVPAFIECLDYIFVGQGISVESVAAMPEKRSILENTALPSPLYPSDHLSVMADVRIS